MNPQNGVWKVSAVKFFGRVAVAFLNDLFRK